MNPTHRAVCLLLVILSLPLSALEVREGLVKAVVDDASGRISLYRLADVAKGSYEPFYFDQDNRTSYVTLSWDGKQYRLGDAPEFQRTVRRTEKGIRIEFASAFCLVAEELEFAKSAGSALADGVFLRFAIENVSQREASAGLRFLIDTALAEKTGLHFRLPSREKVGEETVLEGDRVEPWVRTPGDRADFMIALAGSGIDRPDRVHLANWKRLNDSSWLLDYSSARNFTLLPYSVNDSAVALYWLPQQVTRGATRTIQIALGAFNEGGYPPPQANGDQTGAIFSQTVLTTPATNRSTAIAADLVAVRDLISRIDQVLSSGKPPSPEELEAWKRILDLLEARKKEY